MRQFQLFLLAAICVLLTLVVVELHRLADDLQLGADLRRAVVALPAKSPETRAQRNARLQRQQQELVLDSLAILDTPDPTTSQRPAKAPAPAPRPDRSPR